MNEVARLEKLEATRDALVDSRITPEHARIMGTAAENGPLDEKKMLAAAETESPDHFRKTMRDHQSELAGDDGDARRERQRQADSEPIWLGSTSRHPNFALRAALEARDQGCIGCRAGPEWCISHHIIEWQHDGPTQPDNLVLVCYPCHDKIHHNNWNVEKHPQPGRDYLRPPWQQAPDLSLRR